MGFVTLPFQSNNHLGSIIPVKLFTTDECRKITGIPGEEIPPEVFENNNKSILGETKSYPRSRFIHFDKENAWIFEKLIPLVNETNNNNFNFNINILKDLQVLEFSGDASFEWHMDIGKGNLSTRKLSIIIFLSEQTDYQGGVVQWIHPHTFATEAGTAVFFPSFMPYRIWPVTSGTLNLMIAWADGPSFT